MPNNLYFTSIGFFGLWDAYQFNTIRDSRTHFDTFIRDGAMEELMNGGSGVFWSPGYHGSYKIEVRLNQGLTAEEQTHLYRSSLNHKFVMTGRYAVLGSIEWAGYKERQGMDQLQASRIALEIGTYKVDIYALIYLEGNGGYMDFVISVTPVPDDHQFEFTEQVPILKYVSESSDTSTE